jgi:hypothetical protein
MEAFEEKMRRGGALAVEHSCRFHMGDDPVHKALAKITRRLDEIGIPYVVVGGMALSSHGFVRATVDVDLLVTDESLKLIHEKLSGLGYLPPFTGSRHLRDTENGVKIEFLVTGGFPGDGKPKPVSFPDPLTCTAEINGLKVIDLPRLIDLKLASGMTNINRLKDLADVQELIKALKLPAEMSAKLNPYVREKYLELWHPLQNDPHDQSRQ